MRCNLVVCLDEGRIKPEKALQGGTRDERRMGDIVNIIQKIMLYFKKSDGWGELEEKGECG